MPPTRSHHASAPRDDEAATAAAMLAATGQSTLATEFYSPIPDGYRKGRHKFIVVVGTVMSGLGKGIFSSSVAKLLKDKGLVVAPIKMEGYLNIDSGTLNPYRHGEVFVLDDGTECDMDLGTYERMLDQNLSRRNFLTSGQVFSEILERERRGGYLGRDVQMIPHVTGEVKRKLRELAMYGDGTNPADVVFVEVGGTVGDYENGFYIEALRELAFEEGENSVCFVALTYIVEPPALGEQKSKAAQLGIKRLMEAGVQPHIIACRASKPCTHTVMQKIAMYSNVPMKRVFSMHDRPSIYTIPDALRRGGIDREILGILGLHDRVDPVAEDAARDGWLSFTRSLTSPKNLRVRVGLTGKYAGLRDAYASIDKAVEHCSASLGCDVELVWIEADDVDDANAANRLADIDAVIVPGGFGSRGVEGKIACVRHCRESGTPYLGICLGFQVAVIEYARNVLGLAGANSTEFDTGCNNAVIDQLPEQKKIEQLGGSMRLGGQDVVLRPGSLASWLYEGRATIRQRFRHRYEVEPAMIDRFEQAGLFFTGRHPLHPIMQMLELAQPADGNPASPRANGAANNSARVTHPYFVGAQFHPELLSRPLRPEPMFMGLIAAAMKHKNPDADTGRWTRTAPTTRLKGNSTGVAQVC